MRLKVYFHTFIFTVLVFCLSAFSLKVAADLFGTTGFGEYQIARRGVSLITYPMLMGLGISLTRFLAGASEADNCKTDYFFAAISIVIFNSAIFLIPFLLYSNEIALSFFGSQQYAGFILPIYIAIVGLCLFTLVYSFLRGNLRLLAANTFQLICLGIIPILAIISSSNNPSSSILLTGIAWITVSFVYLITIIILIDKSRIAFSGIIIRIKELILYGIPRIPGEFALFGLFSFPVFRVAYITGIEKAGYFALGLSFLQLVCGIFDFVGVILLPFISKLKKERDYHQIKKSVKNMISLSLLGSIIIVAILYLFMDIIITYAFGPDFLAATDTIKWILPGAFPYILYMILRNPLDAMSKFPYNSINLSVVFVVILGSFYFVNSLYDCVIAILVGLIMVGIMTSLSWLHCIHKVESQGIIQDSSKYG